MAEEVLHDGLNTYLDREMGCLKIPYDQEEGTGKYPPLKICKGVEEKESALKKCNDYYPFGLTFNSSERSGYTTNKFLYNGKELQTDLDLDWYYFGARFYDPTIVRFGQIDPGSELYTYSSPYSYVLNNPVKLVDPTGMTSQQVIYDLDGNAWTVDCENGECGNARM